MAILAGMGALLGGVSNTTGARTGYNTGATSTSGSSTPTFSPLQSALQGSTAGALQNYITRGPNLTPALTAGTENINETYKGIGDRLQQSLASRGFGNSGASGTAALQTETGRAGAVGGLQSQLQQAAMQQQLQALGQASSFGFAAPGSTNTGSSSTAGSFTNPGSAAAGTLSGGLTSILSQLNAAAAAGG